MADVIAASSDVVEPGESNIETGGQSFEPAMKKQRKEDVNVEKRGDKISSDERLETRLGGILCCSVCLDLPSSAVYQVNTTFSIKALFLKRTKVYDLYQTIIYLPFIVPSSAKKLNITAQ